MADNAQCVQRPVRVFDMVPCSSGWIPRRALVSDDNSQYWIGKWLVVSPIRHQSDDLVERTISGDYAVTRAAENCGEIERSVLPVSEEDYIRVVSIRPHAH